jgi:hypothetical protein
MMPTTEGLYFVRINASVPHWQYIVALAGTTPFLRMKWFVGLSPDDPLALLHDAVELATLDWGPQIAVPEAPVCQPGPSP